MTGFPNTRLRRLRQNTAIRDILAMPMPGPEKFIWPVFVTAGENIREPIHSMPGQFRYSADILTEEVAKVMESGVKSIMLFGVINEDEKDLNANAALSPEGLVPNTVRILKKTNPGLFIFSDICTCEYTSHGHCGIVNADGKVDNDASLDLLSRMAVCHADAGVDVVAPSAMMDGQVAAIRSGLDAAGFNDTMIMSYSTKFASAMYGPFREAAASAPAFGDRKTYQADFRDRRTALRESLLDEKEGADILMVKPSLFYLDIIKDIRAMTELPLAAYNVSGEYSMLIATAERGWGDLKALVREATCALSRAGTDIIISYWANQYDKFFRD